MKIEDNMIIEKHDMDYFLNAFLRSYMFYNRGILPAKITIPMPLEVTYTVTGTRLPVEYIEYVPEENTVEAEEALMQEEPSDTSGQRRAREYNKPAKTKRTSKYNATEPNT